MKYLLVVSVFLLACTEFDYSYDLDEYELDVPQEGVFLAIDGDPWLGEYDGMDQPEDGYCGPVAVKNILWWYDGDISWEQAAHELKTNDWDPGFKLWKYCAAACMGEIAGCANACYEVARRQVEGTSETEVIKTLTKHAPKGYRLVVTRENPSMIDEIIYQISQGNPVFIKETINNGNAHASILTGFRWKNGEIHTITANSYNQPLDVFMRGWSRIDLGNRTERYVMGKFGMKPFTAMWFEKI
jgi:hypothetical protein